MKVIGVLLAVVFVLAIFVAAILFLPLLTIWVINTLILGYIPGAGLIPYELFTWQWFAALLGGGTLAGLFGARKTKKSD